MEKNYKELYEQTLEQLKDLYEFYKDNPSQAQKFIEIFPELAESNDEKIRKELIFYFQEEIPQCSIHEHADKMKEFIAWLEKQSSDISLFSNEQRKYMGKYVSLDKITLIKLLAERDANNAKIAESFEKKGDHVNFLSKIQVGDKVTRNEDGVLVNLSQLNRVAKKQSEQKTINGITKEVCKNKASAVAFLKSTGIMNENGELADEYKIEQGEQKPANWLQELEDKLANATPKQLAEWKEKYFKEEPAEWSEDDKKMIGNIRSIIEKYAFSQSAVDVNGDLSEKEYIDADYWLKSLIYKCTWKPSDLQIEALESATENCAYSEYQDCLRELIGQLKNLKG